MAKKEKELTEKELTEKVSLIDAKIKELQAERLEIKKLLLKPKTEVPLNQLNLIASIGAKKAKEKLGKLWVE